MNMEKYRQNYEYFKKNQPNISTHFPKSIMIHLPKEIFFSHVALNGEQGH